VIPISAQPQVVCDTVFEDQQYPGDTSKLKIDLRRATLILVYPIGCEHKTATQKVLVKAMRALHRARETEASMVDLVGLYPVAVNNIHH